MKSTAFKKAPGVLSFQRGILVTDCELFNDIEDEAYEDYPVFVVKHGLRGTQNVNESGDEKKSSTGDTKNRETSNIQQTHSAKLDHRAKGMIATFGVRFLDLRNTLFACAPSKEDKREEITAFRESVDTFVERAKGSDGIKEVARRFVRNLLNGRWLWRNRVIAKHIQISVTFLGNGKTIGPVDSLGIPLNHFDKYSVEEEEISEYLVGGMKGDRLAGIDVKAHVDFGIHGTLEVFPSQNYIESKTKGFARSLYCLGHAEMGKGDSTTVQRIGRAAIRDQKVANALRTIDTWYPEFATYQRPIPVEPNGANLEMQQFFRNDKDASAFKLALKLNELDPNTPDGMFMIACLLRGGVYSGG